MDVTSWILFIAGIMLGILLIVQPHRLREGLGGHPRLLWLLRFLGVFVVGAMFLWAEFISGISGFTGIINIYWLRNPTLVTVTFYVVLSALIVMILKPIKRAWLRSSLITLYFCVTVFAFILMQAMDYSYGTGFIMGELRRSSYAPAENVRILELLRSSNAGEVNANQYAWAVHNLEFEIDWMLPLANDYLVNRSSFRWRLSEYISKFFWGDEANMARFQKNLPSVVEYRETHPAVRKHGSYDYIMKTYTNPNQASQSIGAAVVP
ncbi:MAG: hypothetical protein HY343_03060 [Lentisphaerae bacterium]|nr:hypothetical protein [Lentisphaerota bacterium]